ncbi:MAG TPA: hypothetical protein VFL90_11255 [Methylomirabilota bacterium]|nr:hypothetical protein [Methylomirabilota bacterium]
MTTTSSAAAMTTAAVGLSPKMVVRSEVTARGSAEPSSLLLSLFAVVSVLRVSLRVAAGLSEVAGDPLGAVIEPLAEPDGVETAPLADPAGALWLLLAALWAMAPPARPRVMIAMSRRTATLFMLHLLEAGKATQVPPDGMATLTRSRP